MSAEFSEDLLAHLANLSCLECDPSELDQLSKDLTKMSGLFDQLNNVDTSACATVELNLRSAQNQMRSDETEPFASNQDLLMNAPERVGNLICVPAVICKET